MCSASPPATPDPYAVAKAQGTENRETAIAQGVINNPNINTPFGSQRVTWGAASTPDTFDQAGYDAALAAFNNPAVTPGVGPGQYDFTDERNPVWVPATPATAAPPPNRSDFIIPGTQGTGPGGVQQPTIDQTLSPAGQAQLDSQNRISSQLGTMAEAGLGRVNNAISRPFEINGPGLISGVDRGSAQREFDTPGGMRQSIADAGALQSNVTGGPLQNSIADAGALQSNVNGGSLQYNLANAGDVQRNTNYGQPIQAGLDYSGVSRMPTLDDFGGDRDRIEQALNSRLEPQLQRDEEAMRQRLANQGLTQNHEAYRNDQDTFGRQKNDLRMQTILAGAGEQQRLFNQAMAARQQGVGEVNTQGQFANQAQSQGYNQALASANLANTAQNQQFTQNLAGGNFANAAQSQAFNQGLANANLSNEAQGQRFNQNAANAAFANTAQNQGFNQSLANANLSNEAQGQRFTQNAADAAFANAAQNQQYNQALGSAQFGNQAQNQDFTQALANSGFQNQARQQAIQEEAFLRNQPLNEISALRSGTQVNMPQFQQYQGSNIAPAPIAQQVNQAFGQQQGLYNAEVGQNNAMTGGLFSLGAAAVPLIFSDRRLKSNVVQVGTHPRGIGVYEYDIFGERQRGVMADEVERVLPAAVVMHPSGFKMVNYGVLG